MSLQHTRKLDSRAVDLWLVSLDQADAVSARDLADAADQARYAQIAAPRKQRQFAFRRRALRYVLQHYQDQFTVANAENGKPHLIDMPRLHFSTSSSKNWCAVCVSSSECGVDIEATPCKVDLAGVVQQFMPAMPSAGTDVSCPLRQQLAVLDWCQFEAYTKLHGRTLHQELLVDGNNMPQKLQGSRTCMMAIANLDYVCVIAQAHPFRIANLHQIDFRRIAHA